MKAASFFLLDCLVALTIVALYYGLLQIVTNYHLLSVVFFKGWWAIVSLVMLPMTLECLIAWGSVKIGLLPAERFIPVILLAGMIVIGIAIAP